MLTIRAVEIAYSQTYATFPPDRVAESCVTISLRLCWFYIYIYIYIYIERERERERENSEIYFLLL